jgi:hypothetical protein
VAIALTGCIGDKPMPVPTSSGSSSSSATSTPEPTETIPILRPEGNAAANKQFFDYVNKKFNAANGMSSGQAIIDNLVASGFVKTDMEVTFDTTALEIPADLIVFSVRIKGECLIGQFDASGYTSLQAPLLGTGACLVGTTRPIDW